MDWNSKFAATNVSDSILIVGVLYIKSGETHIINPAAQSKKAMDSLKYYEALGRLTVTNEFTETHKPTKESFSSIRIVETANGANGDTHKHVVFDGEKKANKAISVEQIDTGGRAIDVVIAEPDEGKGVTVKQVTPSESPKQDEKMSKEQAIELLNSHWKIVEKEVNNITDARKLNFLQVVAIELGVAGKKKELIETRLSQI